MHPTSHPEPPAETRWQAGLLATDAATASAIEAQAAVAGLEFVATRILDPRSEGEPRDGPATPAGTDVVVDVPTSTSVREFVSMLRELDPSVELTGRHPVERTEPTNGVLTADLFESLTERQVEVLRTAYYAGFFEWPRTSTGEDIADILGVTQPTVNRHLRVGTRRLLDQLSETALPAVRMD